MQTPSPQSAQRASSAHLFQMAAQLKTEAAHKHKVNVLFLAHGVEDISAEKARRKLGTDFLLSPYLSQGQFAPAISCENKFESHMSGNAAVELISVDRRNFTAGWLYTSSASWLLYWYPNGELLAMQLDELREVVLSAPARFGATTAANPGYLSWNSLMPLEHLARSVDSARIVSYGQELGTGPCEESLFSGAVFEKRCSADDLVNHMRKYPVCTKPREVAQEELHAVARALAPKDRRKFANQRMLADLPWLHAA